MVCPGANMDIGMRTVVAAVILAAPTVPSTASACDPVWLPSSRPAGKAFFIASARTTRLPSGGVPADVIAGRVDSTRLAPGTVNLVPWEFGPDCSPVAWPKRRAWNAPTTRAFYTGQLRPRESWIDALPTFDIHMAWREPLWRRDPELRKRFPNATDSLLTPEEFFELYAALPTDDELKSKNREALQRVDAWVESHRGVSPREPARTILANLRRAYGASAPE
jgi:hypothetical protein